MGYSVKLIYNIFFLLLLYVCYLTFKSYPPDYSKLLNTSTYSNKGTSVERQILQSKPVKNFIYIWIIFTKATVNGELTAKFRSLLQNIYEHGNGNAGLHFNVICDKDSKYVAKSIFSILNKNYNPRHIVAFISYYDFKSCAEKLNDIIQVMTPHFSSTPGTYYSDALFYLSLGLHRLAPLHQKYAIILDCDLVFKGDIQLLYNEFNRFSRENLFGLARELSCVYRNVLHDYRLIHNGTRFGSVVNIKSNEYYVGTVETAAEINGTSNGTEDTGEPGYPGLNSGVLLLNLEKIRSSTQYEMLLSNTSVEDLTKKYLFRGHLGDQDFYTLLGYDKPELIYILNCGWNRQLCKWWRQSGDEKLFDNYYHCPPPIYVYHGNCHTQIPAEYE